MATVINGSGDSTFNGNIIQLDGSPEYHFATDSATHYNWRIAAQEQVNGGFEIASGTQTAGSNASSDTYTNRLVIDSAGRVTMPYQPSFNAKLSTTTTFNDETVLVFGAVAFNIGNHYNSSNGIFTAPVSGRYVFNVHALIQSSSSGYLNLRPQINGANYHTVYGQLYRDTISPDELSGTFLVNLNANDTFNVLVDLALGSTITLYPQETHINGYLLG